MAQTIHLEVVTPNGLAVRTEVDQVEAPSVFGEFGVLPGHLPLLAAVKAGVVRYRHAGKVTALAVEGGFAEAGHDAMTVLTGRAVPGGEVDVSSVKAERDEVQHKIDAHKGESGVEADELVRQRDWLNAQLDAARESGKQT